MSVPGKEDYFSFGIFSVLSSIALLVSASMRTGRKSLALASSLSGSSGVRDPLEVGIFSIVNAGGFIVHSFSSSPTHRFDMTEILYKMTENRKSLWTDARRPVPRLWIRSAEERGQRRYENGNTTTTNHSFSHFQMVEYDLLGAQPKRRSQFGRDSSPRKAN